MVVIQVRRLSAKLGGMVCRVSFIIVAVVVEAAAARLILAAALLSDDDVCRRAVVAAMALPLLLREAMEALLLVETGICTEPWGCCPAAAAAC